MIKELLIFAAGVFVGKEKDKGALFGGLIVLGLLAYTIGAILLAVTVMFKLFVILPLKILRRLAQGHG